MTSTISTTIVNTVTLGNGSYTSPLTITSTGGIITSPGRIAFNYFGNTALFITSPGTVTNNGVIIGGHGFNEGEYSSSATSGANGVSMSTGTFINTGTVTGGAGGARYSYHDSGTNLSGGTGIMLSGGVVTNSGTIAGGTGGSGNSAGDTGGRANGGNGGYGAIISGGTLTNTGNIAGGVGGAGFDSGSNGGNGTGVLISGGLLIDNGTITGSTAVKFSGAAAATVLVESAASFTGSVLANGDANATLAIGGTTPFLLNAIGSKFTGFQNFAFAGTGPGFALEGSAAALAGGETISGFAANDRIILDGFVAASETFTAPGVLVLTDSGGGTQTLDLTGLTSSSQLLVTNNGTNTTITSEQSEITSAVTASVSLGNGTYGSNLLITNSGAVTGTAGAAGYYNITMPAGAGSAGALGVTGGTGTNLTNDGRITGGAGGWGGNGGIINSTAKSAGGNGGTGNVGVSLFGASIVNDGIIAGGTGGTGGAGSSYRGETTTRYRNYYGGNGNAGGAGLVLTSGTGVNLQSIAGGAGGAGGAAGYYHNYSNALRFFRAGNGASGGTGLVLTSGASFTNQGVITGGAGGAAGHNNYRSAYNGTQGPGGIGAYVNGSTLINAGYIGGNAGADAVLFGASAATLIVAAAGHFTGAIAANTTAADVLEFASGASLNLGTSFTGFAHTDILAAAAVTLSGDLFSAVVNNGTINVADGTSLTFASALTGTGLLIDDPATIVLDGAVASGQTVSLDGTGNTLELGDAPDFHGTITGFGAADALIIDHFTASSASYAAGTLVLSGSSGAAPETLILDITGSFSAADFTLSSDGAGSTDVVTCFYPGTRITTTYGEVAVEDLREGMELLTANGHALPLRWLGRSDVSLRFADKLRALPIRICAGALGNGLPRRDLLVSPDHAMFIDDVLVHASALVNGVSVRREHDVPECFSYYHVELETHELLLAEGAAAESFVDNVGRMHFANWDERTAPEEPIAEMPYPRAKAWRQLPPRLRTRYAA